METIQNNGDVNVLLITVICIGIIIVFFVIISIFFGKGKKEDADGEDYYDTIEEDYEEEYTNVKKVPARKFRRKKLSEGKITTNQRLRTISRKPVLKTIKKMPVKKTTQEKQEIENPDDIIIKDIKIANDGIYNTLKLQDSSDDGLVADSIKNIKKTEITTNIKQKTVKISKIGNIQVDSKFNLDIDERKMIESVMNYRNRGHIFQILQGRKIMDLGIDSMNQLEHIEKQISIFSDNNGKYMLYLIWDSSIKHIIRLSHQIRYSPRIRY